MNNALFQYSVRESRRSKSIRLRVTVQGGLEVVIPRDYDRRKIPGILHRKRQWIRAAVDRADENRKFLHPTTTWHAPQRIVLPAIGREWQLQHRPASVPWTAVREAPSGVLQLRGNITDEAACRAALHRWLSRTAHLHLIPILHDVSRAAGFRFARVYVKRQRTRWASCSRHKSITLNAKLLFLSPDLVRYVIIHELCHTQEMRHSKQFWLHVQSACPDYRALDARLRDAWKALPAWAHPSITAPARQAASEPMKAYWAKGRAAKQKVKAMPTRTSLACP